MGVHLVFTHRALWCSGVDLAACVKSAGWLLSFTGLCLMVLAVSAQASWCLAGKRGGQSWHWGNTGKKHNTRSLLCARFTGRLSRGQGPSFQLALIQSLLIQSHHNSVSYWSLSQLQKNTILWQFCPNQEVILLTSELSFSGGTQLSHQCYLVLFVYFVYSIYIYRA